MSDGTESGANRQALRPRSGDLMLLDLAAEVARLKQQPQWDATDRHALSLVKDAGLNVMLLVLKRGAHMAEHHAKGPIALHVLEGCIRFSANGQSVQATAGKLLALDRQVPHGVEAVEESTLLLITAIG
ncbi:MAG TPA: hypothetical protein VKV28_04265 [Candidatus Binataceae bacterium]|nr:hypothetical protein [Candidatus Binataceae bacterium]